MEVDVNGADEGVETGGEETVPDDIIWKGLYDGCFEGRDALLAKGCTCGVREGVGL